jgi:hypothetical protein
MAAARAAKAAKAAGSALNIPPADVIEKMTPAELEAKRQQLIAELDAISVKPTAGQPGTKVGEGLTSEYVPYTAKWFMDNEQLNDVIPVESQGVIVNGVRFELYGGRRCKLPTSHYLVYLNQLDGQRQLEEKYAQQPGNPQFVVSRLPGVWQKTPIE